MIDSTEQNDDGPYSFYQEVDEIYIETESSLQKIKGWAEFKDKWSDYLSNHIKKNKIKQSLECFLVIWFDHELKEETKLFKDESPEEPDNENITADKVEEYKKKFDRYILDLKEWNKKLINVAPKALENVNFGDIFNIEIQDGNHSDKEYIGDDPAKFMNMAFSYKEEKDWDSAIDFLKKSFDAFEKSPLEYPYDFNIQDFLRLPLYMHQGGYIEEAWKTFNNFLSGNFPIKVQESEGLEKDHLKTWECRDIYDKMRVSSVREKKYAQALTYKCLELFFGCAEMFFSYNIEGYSTYKKALKENSEKPRIVERLKTNLKKAKLENEGDRIAELIVEAISFLPNYKKGQEKILKEIYK